MTRQSPALTEFFTYPASPHSAARRRHFELASTRNNVLAAVGLLLIAVGAVALFYRGIPYTSSDVVVEVGPLKATTESSKTWPVPPILGGLAIAGGVILIIAGARKA